MEKIKYLKKSWWVSISQARQIKKEAREKKISESALMRHIINSWFKK